MPPSSSTVTASSAPRRSLEGLNARAVGFISPRSMFFDGAYYWTDAATGRLLEVLQRNAGRLRVALCLAPAKTGMHEHRLKFHRDDIVELPWLAGAAKGSLQTLPCARAIGGMEGECDVSLVQLPFAAPLALLRARVPRVYHVCADIWETSRASPKYAGLKRPLAMLAGSAIDTLQSYLVHRRGDRLICNGQALWDRYAPADGRVVVSGSLKDKEVMSASRSRPMDAPLRVLYVGYLRWEKGIDTLLDAFARVQQAVPDAELHVVGSENSSSQLSDMVRGALVRMPHSAAVKFVGHRSFGPELFQCYADADVLVVPSRSEGTPRVLIEARAFGCPVIGTRVGGIPSSITHEVDGLLIEPDNPEMCAQAILRIANDRALAERLRANGLQRARKSTIEQFAQAVTEELCLAAASQLQGTA